MDFDEFVFLKRLVDVYFLLTLNRYMKFNNYIR
jgi:hypothetical protein